MRTVQSKFTVQTYKKISALFLPDMLEDAEPFPPSVLVLVADEFDNVANTKV